MLLAAHQNLHALLLTFVYIKLLLNTALSIIFQSASYLLKLGCGIMLALPISLEIYGASDMS